MSRFQKCPKCGGEEFDEVCLEWTSQKGVSVGPDGYSNYDYAEGTDPLGDVTRRYYWCRECDIDLYIIDGKLATEEPKEPEGGSLLNQFDGFECHHCVEFEDPLGNKYVEQINPEEAQRLINNPREDTVCDTFWSVYGHFREELRENNGCLQCLADFKGETIAEAITKALNKAKGVHYEQFTKR